MITDWTCLYCYIVCGAEINTDCLCCKALCALNCAHMYYLSKDL